MTMHPLQTPDAGCDVLVAGGGMAGIATGLAAALAARQHCLPRELPVAMLLEALAADGVDLARGGHEQDL